MHSRPLAAPKRQTVYPESALGQCLETIMSPIVLDGDTFPRNIDPGPRTPYYPGLMIDEKPNLHIFAMSTEPGVET